MQGFPTLRGHGIHEETKMEYIVLTKLDVDLNYLFDKFKKKLKKATVVNIGIQLLDRIERIHGLGYVHNDIKP